MRQLQRQMPSAALRTMGEKVPTSFPNEIAYISAFFPFRTIFTRCNYVFRPTGHNGSPEALKVHGSLSRTEKKESERLERNFDAHEPKNPSKSDKKIQTRYMPPGFCVARSNQYNKRAASGGDQWERSVRDSTVRRKGNMAALRIRNVRESRAF